MIVAGPGQRRKLAAILSADVVGYSKLMADDESATIATLKECRAAIGRVIERHAGRVVNAPGDNMLVEFPSAVESVQAAIEIQRDIEGRNAELPEVRRMHFRVGVNLGDVIEEDDGTIYGDGVNIAARIEALAEEGGVCISSTIYDAVEGKLDFGFDFLGEQQVKNIAKPVRVYRVRAEPGEKPAKPTASRTKNFAAIAAIGVLVVAIASISVWQTGRGTTSEEIGTAAADDPLLLPTGPAIAVLPFENLSGDPEQEYFSDGLTEDIISRLTRFGRFFVIARNSTGQYKGRSVDVRQIGRELGARYVVEGSVRKSEDSVRVTAQLIDAEDGTHMWAATFDRDLTAADLFQVQDEITEQVAGTIADQTGIIVRAKIEAIRNKPTDSLDAYECVLRTIKYYDGQSPDAHRNVRDCLQHAVEVDPNYSDAWAALANVYLDESRYGFNPTEGSLDRALDAGLRSVQLDPVGEWGAGSLAKVYFHRNELDAFFAEANRAIAINPNHATNLAALGELIFWAGQIERGHAMVEKAAALNPHHAGWYNFALTAYPYLKGDYETALEFAHQIRMPDFYFNHAFLAAIYSQLGRTEEARAATAKVLELYPNFAEDYHGIADGFNLPEQTRAAFIDGYRKAGINIPDRLAKGD
jgi:adenylate cyclase